MEHQEKLIKLIWEKATEVAGISPENYRKDVFGALIRKDRFGECSMPLSFGWCIIAVDNTPITDTTPAENIIPMQWQNAIVFKSGLKSFTVTSNGHYNKYTHRNLPQAEKIQKGQGFIDEEE